MLNCLRSVVSVVGEKMCWLNDFQGRSKVINAVAFPARFKVMVPASRRTLMLSHSFERSEKVTSSGLPADIVKEKIRHIMNCLGVSENDALLLISQYHRLNCKITNLDEFVVTLKRTQLDICDIIKHPRIFKFLPKTIEQRYARLVEIGLDKPSTTNILGFAKIVANEPKHFKDEVLITTASTPLDTMISCLDGPPNLKQIIDERYPLLKDQSLNNMHMVLHLEYLTWRLGVERERVVAIIKKYKAISNHSLKSIVELWHMLTNHLKFTAEKIKGNGFLLTLHSSDVRQLLSHLPLLGGCTTETLILKFPKILPVPIHCLKEIDACLSAYGVTALQVEKCANVFTLRPSTLKQRMQEMEDIPEFWNLRIHPRFLHLVYYQTKAKHRLKLMKILGFTEFTVDVLCTSEQYFINFVDSKENKKARSNFVTFLAKQLKCPKTIIRFKVQPYSLSNVCVASVNKNVEYLFDCGFSRQEILSQVPVVLYDPSSLRKKLSEVCKNNESALINRATVLKIVLGKLKASHKHTPICSKILEPVSELKYGRYVLEDNVPVSSYIESKVLKNMDESD